MQGLGLWGLVGFRPLGGSKVRNPTPLLEREDETPARYCTLSRGPRGLACPSVRTVKVQFNSIQWQMLLELGWIQTHSWTGVFLKRRDWQPRRNRYPLPRVPPTMRSPDHQAGGRGWRMTTCQIPIPDNRYVTSMAFLAKRRTLFRPVARVLMIGQAESDLEKLLGWSGLFVPSCAAVSQEDTAGGNKSGGQAQKADAASRTPPEKSALADSGPLGQLGCTMSLD